MRPISEIRVDDEQVKLVPPPLRPGVFSDIPGWVWNTYLGGWAALFALFLVFFATDGPATMMVITACFFALMILGLPAALGTQTEATETPSDGMIHTLSGALPIRAAATQILLIPIASVFGLLMLMLLTR
jgi:hypothetical protein